MATLYISEYAQLGSAPSTAGANHTPAQAPLELPLAEYTVPITGSSTSSPQFNANTRAVRLHTDTICSVAFGTAPIASTTNKRLAQNQTEYFSVQTGQAVAVIVNV